MAIDRSFADNADLQGLQGDAIVELWTLDLQPIDPAVAPGQRFIYFCNWAVADGQPVQYGGITYTAIPYKAGGFTYQTEGVPPSPSLTISNVGLEFTGLVNEWNDLIGARLTRRRVLARYLDSGSSPDPNAHWPDEAWFVQQKESEGKLLVTFKLSTAFDLDGVLLPRRRALRYTCPWVYRGEGCDYSGPPVADINDNPLTTSADPLVEAVLTTRAAIPPARADYQAASSAYGTAQANTANALSDYNYWVAQVNSFTGTWFYAETEYRVQNPIGPSTAYWREYGGITTVIWHGNNVGASNEHRRGKYRATFDGRTLGYLPGAYYEIQRWAYSTSGYANLVANRDAALVAYNNAVAAEAAAKAVYDTEKADYDTAISNYNTAITNWQAAGTQDTNDVCGKRLASCRLRFFDPVSVTYEDLPYGGFPGLTT